MAYAYPYILLMTIYGVLAILHKYYQDVPNRTSLMNALAIIIFILFFGFRGFVAYDWSIYYWLYTFNIPEIGKLVTVPFAKWPTEPGFTILASICKTIINNYFVFQFVCTSLNLFLILRFFKRYTNNFSACLLLFLPMGGIQFCTDLMRNSLAIFIFLNGIQFIEKKKLIHYLAICLLASSFHMSAFAYIPMYFILNRKFNKQIVIIIFIVANIVCICHIPLLKSIVVFCANITSRTAAQYIDAYMSMDSNNASAFGIGYLERLFTGVMVLCYRDKLRNLRKTNILVNSILLYLFINLFLSEFRTISVRCSNLFIFAYWIVWQDLAKCIYHKGNKILYLLFIASYCLLKTYSGNSGTMSLYYNILIDTKSHSERVLYFNKHLNDK